MNIIIPNPIAYNIEPIAIETSGFQFLIKGVSTKVNTTTVTALKLIKNPKYLGPLLPKTLPSIVICYSKALWHVQNPVFCSAGYTRSF